MYVLAQPGNQFCGPLGSPGVPNLFSDGTVQGRQSQPGVTHQGIAYRIASSDDVGVDVQLHHFNGTRFGQAPFFGNHGTAGTADKKYQVRIADQIVAVGKASVAADHAECSRDDLRQWRPFR
jgi:hypothetical protein